MTTENMVIVECSGIFCSEKLSLPLIDGWTGSGGVDQSAYGAYCPREGCQLQSEFFHNQCPGCAALFPDCGLGESFQYSHNVSIGDKDKEALRSGWCPYRTNGTFSFTKGRGKASLDQFDISTKATPEQGAAVVAGIEAYISKYCSKK